MVLAAASRPSGPTPGLDCGARVTLLQPPGANRRLRRHRPAADSGQTPPLCRSRRHHRHRRQPHLRLPAPQGPRPPDPGRHHHRTREEAHAEAAEAEVRRQFDHDWTVATEARRPFLREYLAQRGKAPAGTLHTATELLYGFPAHRTIDLNAVADLLSLTPDTPPHSPRRQTRPARTASRC
jgi:hypothetical protein